MSRALTHRGPDEEGFLERKGISLASRRLSIVDLAEGQQPMTNEDRSVGIQLVDDVFGHHFIDPDDSVSFTDRFCDCAPHFLSDFRGVRRSGTKNNLEAWVEVFDRVNQMNNTLLPRDPANK